MEFLSGKRYNAIDGYYKDRFGCKIAKVPLDGGFTCPNRDGTKGYGGCIYCSERLSGDFTHPEAENLYEQFMLTKAALDNKWKNLKYIPYFQSGSATYAPTDYLRKLYYEALSLPNSVGISIATRPDCICADVLDLLSELSQKTYISVELGLQSVFDETGRIINRCTSFEEFVSAFNSLKERGICTCVHLINGLPNETREMMLESVRTVSKMKPHSVKIHLLNIIKNTPAEKIYNEGKIKLFELEEYIKLACDELEILDSSIYVARITADCERSKLIAPEWSFKKRTILNGIDKELSLRNTYQGIYAN